MRDLPSTTSSFDIRTYSVMASNSNRTWPQLTSTTLATVRPASHFAPALSRYKTNKSLREFTAPQIISLDDPVEDHTTIIIKEKVPSTNSRKMEKPLSFRSVSNLEIQSETIPLSRSGTLKLTTLSPTVLLHLSSPSSSLALRMMSSTSSTRI
jgi:hypothetical protein